MRKNPNTSACRSDYGSTFNFDDQIMRQAESSQIDQVVELLAQFGQLVVVKTQIGQLLLRWSRKRVVVKLVAQAVRILYQIVCLLYVIKTKIIVLQSGCWHSKM